MRAQLGKKRIDLPMDALGAPSGMEMSNIPQPEPMPPQMDAQPLIPGEWMSGTPEPAMPMEEDPYAGQISGIEGQLNALNNPPPEPLWKKIANLGQGISTMDPAEFRRQGYARAGQEFQQKTQREQMLRNQLTDIQNRQRQGKVDARQQIEDRQRDELHPLQVQTAQANLTKAQAPVKRGIGERTIETGGKKNLEYFYEDDPATTIFSREAGAVATPGQTFQDREAALVEAGYAQSLGTTPDKLSPLQKVQARGWYDRLTPKEKTDFDKRLDLITKNPDLYDRMFGRADAITPANRLATVRGMIAASRNLMGDIDPAIYEQQRQIYSKAFGIDLPTYEVAKVSAAAGDAPAEPAQKLNTRKYNKGQVVIGDDKKEYKVVGFDTDGEPLVEELKR